MRNSRLCGLILVSMLSGCGKGESPNAVAPAGPPPSQIDLPAGSLGRGDQEAIDALFAAGRAARAVRTATASLQMVCSPSDSDSQAATYDFAFRAPGVTRLEITASEGGGRIGQKLRLAPDGSSVRAPGIWGLLLRPKDAMDQALRNGRGHRLVDAMPVAVALRLEGSADARTLGRRTQDGLTLDLVEVPHGPRFDPSVRREVVGLDPVTRNVRWHAMYEGSRKVYTLNVDDWRPGAPVTDDDLAI